MIRNSTFFSRDAKIFLSSSRPSLEKIAGTVEKRAGNAMTYNDSILELARIIGSANPKPREVLSPLHLLDFTSDERVLTELRKSISTTKISRIIPIDIPSSALLTSLKAKIGGHKIHDAVEVLVF